MISRRRFAAAIITLALYPASVHGSDLSASASVGVKEEYNSNILFSPGAAVEDFITVLSPGAEIAGRTERLETGLSVDLAMLYYAKNTGLNAVNQTFRGRLRYRATPLCSVGADAGYLKDSNPALTSLSTGVVMSADPWSRITSSASANCQLSEEAAGSVSYGYGRGYYEDIADPDDESHDLSAALTVDLGKYFPLAKGKLSAGYGRYDFRDSTIETVSGSAGLSWALSEKVRIAVDGGLRNTRSEGTSAFSGPWESDGWGWVASAAVNYTGQSAAAGLTYARDVTPAHGLGGAAERDTWSISARKLLSEDFSIMFSAAYYALESVSGPTASTIDQRILQVSPALRYEFSREAAIDAKYEYVAVDYPSTGVDAQKQIISVRLSILHDFLD